MIPRGGQRLAIIILPLATNQRHHAALSRTPNSRAFRVSRPAHPPPRPCPPCTRAEAVIRPAAHAGWIPSTLTVRYQLDTVLSGPLRIYCESPSHISEWQQGGMWDAI